MRAPSSLKQEFLRKWILGLQICSSSAKSMSISERKKAIKLSADIAMASARNGRTSWSRALIASASKDDNHGKLFVQQILGSDCERLTKISTSIKRLRCKKILKKSSGTIIRRRMKRIPDKAVASSIAKQMVKKRTQILKSLVPGGVFMDEVSLIEETLDYILSLRAQIDVMRSLAEATEMMMSC